MLFVLFVHAICILYLEDKLEAPTVQNIFGGFVRQYQHLEITVTVPL